MDKDQTSVTSLHPVGCTVCEGSGWERICLSGGTSAVKPCACQQQKHILARQSRAAIPPRYEHCSLDSFNSSFPGADATLAAAHFFARKFVNNYPVETRGILFVGTIGVGKTHLAVGALKALIAERGAQGLFCDYRELLRQIQNTYNPQIPTTESEVLTPIFNAEILVLDELGAIRPSEWVWDTVSLILNHRYNQMRTTIITTNYPALAPGVGLYREETLGDRIGERMRSRLMEMCQVVEMHGEDHRLAGLSSRRPVTDEGAGK